MTRLKDLAVAAGVSIRTVTRALNNAPDVNAATRARIRELAAELRYRPHRGARSLRQQKSFTVIMLVADLDELTTAKAAALERRLRTAGYSLELLFIPAGGETAAREVEAVEELTARRPSGLVLPFRLTEARRAAAEAGLPCVALDAPPGTRADAVIIDRPQGVYEAVSYLLRRGRRRPAYVGPAAGGRRKGYRLALAAWDRSLRPLYLAPEEAPTERRDDFDYGRAAARAWAALPSSRRPDAVQTYTDRMALGFLYGLHENGAGVPEETAVVGFDDRAAAALSYPRLTTVAQPNEEVGRSAAEILLKKLAVRKAAGGRMPKIPSRVVPTRLIVREST